MRITDLLVRRSTQEAAHRDSFDTYLMYLLTETSMKNIASQTFSEE